jgi:hypothetical protein
MSPDAIFDIAVIGAFVVLMMLAYFSAASFLNRSSITFE